MSTLTKPPATRASGTGTPDRSSSRGYWLYLLPGGLLFAAVIILPFGMNLGLSFASWPGVGDIEWTGTENYVRLFGDETFWASFRNSVAMIIAMVVVPTAVGLLLASVLFDVIGKRFGGRTASTLRALYYLPQILPVAIAGIVMGWILRPQDGALNTLLEAVGLGDVTQNWLGDPGTALPSVMAIMVWVQIGYPVVIFMAALQRVDPELYEAAEIDGAGWFRRFRAITIPQIRPETFVVALTCTIAAMKVFGPVFVLTRGGPGDATNVPSYFAYQNFFERADVGYGAAISTILTLIIIVLSVIFIRFQAKSERKERGR
ncbi:sugar ABC transporter permease [Actinobacteria bacterium YIM 96077]|uniref:Sugar ABC transporter permease n=1 Tax=Phytoactinopolyspora halophila TaxID=1981511 RepID=A0A329QEE0_9ACTN|nr:sugar ABC transporter permease [Phytoactinopolyspora halophila]AYY13431.1 sugar ABC transporter permease [Actinobacteria bacterium YIM 96077]RAW10825.1 sugar ABC transporter permease [Phytoactinopolyspora halophila]